MLQPYIHLVYKDVLGEIIGSTKVSSIWGKAGTIGEEGTSGNIQSTDTNLALTIHSTIINKYYVAISILGTGNKTVN